MIYFLSLICLALPTYLIRFKIFGIPTTALEVLIYIGVLAQIFVLRKSLFENRHVGRITKFVTNNEQRITSNEWLFPIALFLLAAIISTIISPDKRVSLGILKGWFFDPILLFGLIVLNVKNEEDFKKIVYGLATGAGIVSFWGILQWFGFSYLLPHQRTDPSFPAYLATGRAFGPFESPNYLGMYLAPIAVLTLGYWLIVLRRSLFVNREVKRITSFVTNNEQRTTNNSYFLSFALCSMLLALLFTKSLGAWLGFFVAAVFISYFILKSYSLILIALMLPVAFFLANKLGTHRILDSFAARKEAWQVSWYLIKKHPILGISLGTFRSIYEQTIPTIHFPPINWLQMHPHNIFLAFWLNLGILGLLSFLWLLYNFFKSAFSNLTNQLRPHSICLTASMIAILTHGIIDTTYWKNDLSAMFWIIMGLTFVVRNSSFVNRHEIRNTKFVTNNEQ